MSTPKPLIDKHESRRIRVQIRRVLLETWDPIGIKDEPNAQDEYDRYIGRLYELLVSDAPDSELAGYLYWVTHDQMGFEQARASDMADTVKALRLIPIRPRQVSSRIPEREPASAPGDFYVENNCCISCGIPQLRL